ncbi:MAG TPA: hypothetical protein VE944_24645 [Nostoc sp.]|uniref:hypothetical protein n=1 Tax=Nostoc sp. TaxID=1180 RepID=UPI002D600436|nr:hypothetical protein [Nostoc sp.]HYX17486.1 hypothetical protein [Nostoc sp.]
MTADNRLMVRISTEKKNAFINRAKIEGKNATEALLALIDKYIGQGENQGDELEEIRQRLKTHEAEILSLKQKMEQEVGESAA